MKDWYFEKISSKTTQREFNKKYPLKRRKLNARCLKNIFNRLMV